MNTLTAARLEEALARTDGSPRSTAALDRASTALTEMMAVTAASASAANRMVKPSRKQPPAPTLGLRRRKGKKAKQKRKPVKWAKDEGWERTARLLVAEGIDHEVAGPLAEWVLVCVDHNVPVNVADLELGLGEQTLNALGEACYYALGDRMLVERQNTVRTGLGRTKKKGGGLFKRLGQAAAAVGRAKRKVQRAVKRVRTAPGRAVARGKRAVNRKVQGAKRAVRKRVVKAKRDFRAGMRGESVLDEREVVTQYEVQRKATDLTNKIGEAYNAAIAFKGALDRMEHIPPTLQRPYDRTMRIMTSLGNAKQDAYQSQMELRRRGL